MYKLRVHLMVRAAIEPERRMPFKLRKRATLSPIDFSMLIVCVLNSFAHSYPLFFYNSSMDLRT
jgi:hypothetical protein